MTSIAAQPRLALSIAALAATVAVFGAGCKHPGARLEGHWRGQRVEGVVSDYQTPATDFAVHTEILARGNQIAVLTPYKQVQGTFFVDSEDKTRLVIHTDKDGTSDRETFLFSDDAKTMTWRVDETRSIVFTKIAATP